MRKFLIPLLALMLIYFSSCQKDMYRIIAVKTKDVQVKNEKIIVKGEITDLGESGVKDHGFVFSQTQNPTIDNSKKSLGVKSVTGDYSDTISNIALGNYYLRAFVFDGSEAKYGENKTFSITDVFPILSTNVISNVLQTGATSGGNITSDGGISITARGVCWSTSQNPTINDNHTTDGSGIGNFTSQLTVLSPNITYYARAYATNNSGTFYGNEISFTTLTFSNCGSVTDIDGNTYNTISIGSQCWMKENLKTTKYRDGTSITNETNNSAWSNLNTGAYSDYNNDANNSNTYGRLYNWYAASDSRIICPTGWHVPTDADWTALTNYLGGESIAGGKMKEAGTIDSSSPNSGADNSSGFTALPFGYRNLNGTYYGIGYGGIWWSTTQNDVTTAFDRGLYNSASNINKGIGMKKSGFSVRCIKD